MKSDSEVARMCIPALYKYRDKLRAEGLNNTEHYQFVKRTLFAKIYMV